jgi:SAM-dependent methyltransferase
MSAFSADWLALREPADRRARNPVLLERLREAFAGQEEATAVDLGCGTGANLRACAAHLPPGQHWRLVDHDPALLAAARARLAAWAERSEPAADGGMRVEHAGKVLTVSFHQADLARDVEALIPAGADLVTAAALFDLVSPAFIERVAEAVAARGAGFYTALTYDGRERWAPPHPADAPVLAAFHAHQRRDKGFGPAAGPDATAALEASFARRGYALHRGDSAWRLGPEDAELIRELVAGAAAAALEAGAAPEAVSAWRDARLQGASCTIGHTDLLALPPRR